MMTIAPEAFSNEQVEYLSKHGVILSLGHSNASYEVAEDCFNHGATAVTHLFNAMSGLTGRDPGLIGSALNNPNCYVGIIPDLHHVHHANVLLAANLKPETLFIVTDCHSPAGTSIEEFDLTGRHMYVRDGKCVDINGTLCGSNILMHDALKNCVNSC